MWSAKIGSITADLGGVKINLVFNCSDGRNLQDEIIFNSNTTQTEINNYIQGKINDLSNIDTTVSTLQPIANKISNITPKP